MDVGASMLNEGSVGAQTTLSFISLAKTTNEDIFGRKQPH